MSESPHGGGIPLAPLIADLSMAQQMYDASPDGKADAERIEQLLGTLSAGTVELEISGQWDGGDDM